MKYIQVFAGGNCILLKDLPFNGVNNKEIDKKSL